MFTKFNQEDEMLLDELFDGETEEVIQMFQDYVEGDE